MFFGKKSQPTQAQPTYAPAITVPYQTQAPLVEAVKYILENPSIPLSMRRQFYVLWENSVFGNYTERDILLLMSKFREWAIMLKWFIPEQKWGNVIIYEDIGDANSRITQDLNMLLNTLYQLYYINLTRGKDGFTVRELNTVRSFTQTGSEPNYNKKRELRLF